MRPIWLPEEALPAAFAPHASADEHAVLLAILRPIAVPRISAKVARPLRKDRPPRFPLAEADQMIVPAIQQFMAERMKAPVRSHKSITRHPRPPLTWSWRSSWRRCTPLRRSESTPFAR